MFKEKNTIVMTVLPLSVEVFWLSRDDCSLALRDALEKCRRRKAVEAVAMMSSASLGGGAGDGGGDTGDADVTRTAERVVLGLAWKQNLLMYR